MNTKYKQNIILTFFCLTLTWFAVFYSDSEPPGFFYRCYDLYTPRIESILQRKPTNAFRTDEQFSLRKQHTISDFSHLEAIPTQWNQTFLIPQGISVLFFREYQIYSPIQRLISILHKKQIHHQSSEDEPPLYDTLLS